MISFQMCGAVSRCQAKNLQGTTPASARMTGLAKYFAPEYRKDPRAHNLRPYGWAAIKT